MSVLLSEIRSRHSKCTKTNDFNERNALAHEDRGSLLDLVDELRAALEGAMGVLSTTENLYIYCSEYTVRLQSHLREISNSDKRKWLAVLEKTVCEVDG